MEARQKEAYIVEVNLVKTRKPKHWKSLLAKTAELASQYNFKLLDIDHKNLSFKIRANYSDRHKGSTALEKLFLYFDKDTVPRENVRMNVFNNSELLEDLLKQTEENMSNRIMVDDFYVYYLPQEDAEALKAGEIRTSRGLYARCRYVGKEAYGVKVNQKEIMTEVRKIIGKLKNDNVLGMVVAVETLFDAVTLGYFGPYVNFTGNYKAKLQYDQKLPPATSDVIPAVYIQAPQNENNANENPDRRPADGRETPIESERKLAIL